MNEGHPEAQALYDSLTSYLPALSGHRTDAYNMTYAEFKALLSAEVQEPEWE